MSPHLRLRISSFLPGLALWLTATALPGQISLAFDDTRLTEFGPAGDPAWDAIGPRVVPNRLAGVALLLWTGPGPDGVDAGNQVFAALLDSGTMEPVSETLQVSEVGTVAGQSRSVTGMAAALNPLDGSYLVVWTADDPEFGLADGQFELFGRRLVWHEGAWGLSPIGPISESGGPAALTNRDASQPAVAFGTAQQEWLVVWQADDAGLLLADNENEILARRVSSGFVLQPGPSRVSSMGPDGGAGDAMLPGVVYHPATDRFLAVWQGDDVAAGWVQGRMEIFGRLIHAATGDGVLAESRISFAGPTDDVAFQSAFPAAAWNSESDRFLIAWAGRRDDPAIGPDEVEIWAHELLPDLSDAGSDTLRVSEMGEGAGESAYATGATVAWDPVGGQYLFAWMGWHETLAPVSEVVVGWPVADLEIWGRSVRPGGPAGFTLGPQLAISDLGGDAASPDLFDADWGHGLASLGDGQFVAVWAGDDDLPGMADDEVEIFGEIVGGHWLFADDFEGGDVLRWSTAAP